MYLILMTVSCTLHYTNLRVIYFSVRMVDYLWQVILASQCIIKPPFALVTSENRIVR